MKPSELKKLAKLYDRKTPPETIVGPILGRMLGELSHQLQRQLGLLINRKGEVETVVVGDMNRIVLPPFGRVREGRGRFRGLRLIHTHLKEEPLSNEDLTDLSLLRLDCIAALTMRAEGLPNRIHWAHLLPENPENERWEVYNRIPFHDLEVDFLEMIEALEAEFAAATSSAEGGHGRERAILIHVTTGPTHGVKARMMELKELARTAGVEVVGEAVQSRRRFDPKFLVGKGKLEEILLDATQLGVDLLIFDTELSPGQIRAIGNATDLKAIDRNMLILDIFAQHAQSSDGKLQVELAQLRYMLPRLMSLSSALSRLTGGIGGRGPGETKLEIDRRRTRGRIGKLERQIKKLSHHRQIKRSRRVRQNVPVVAVVGYTNSGKSSLVNRLTGSDVYAANQLFATLDPTSRRLRFPREREIVLVDTVGFIHELPKDLVNAFKATLEELTYANLLLHLIDGSNPAHEAQRKAVERILEDMVETPIPHMVVYNKIDLVSDDERFALHYEDHDHLISVLTGEGLSALGADIERTMFTHRKQNSPS